MKVWIVLLKVFGYIWLTAAVLLILAGMVGTWMKGGFSAVQELLSPFNVVNWIVAVITLAPGLGALAWAEKLKAKSSLIQSGILEKVITMGPANPNVLSQKERDAYLVYRQRIDQFLHLFLLWEAIEEGGTIPSNVMGHGKTEFASTLRTAMIGWLASLVDEDKSALNVFDLWLNLFPERTGEIKAVRDAIRPQLGLLIDFRNNVAFHANKSTQRQDNVLQAICKPELTAATGKFLDLCIALLREDRFDATS